MLGAAERPPSAAFRKGPPDVTSSIADQLHASQALLSAAWDSNDRLRIQNARLAFENERLREELAALREGREARITHPEATTQ